MAVMALFLFGTLATFSFSAQANTTNDYLQNPGSGCQKRMTDVCPNWENDQAACLACVKAKIGRLEPNCTLSQAEDKCTNPPTTQPHSLPVEPTAKPAPTITPKPGAVQPHVVLWVVDDQGFANIGFHNPENVHTPITDKLASQGIILDRHYTFRWCAPTRSALMTGRLPYHVLQNTDNVDRGFSMLPSKLRQVGYQTHQIGKWHLGSAVDWMTPYGRGFDTSLGYLGGGEDHYTQIDGSEFGCTGVDLYQTDHPAYGINGTYGTYIYDAEAKRVITAHDAQKPLFLYMALQVMHAPNEVPTKFSDFYPSPKYDSDYSIMNGMASAADEVLGNVTDLLMQKGMWNNTFFIYTSDNGGPAGQASSGHAGNNFPLRGGKTNFFEGGVRVSAFITGGAIPTGVRGQHRSGYIHACDWYPTVITLAGGDPTDEGAGMPSVDGYDMWPYITGGVESSPRTEMMIGTERFTQKTGQTGGWNGALISGDFKLILGIQSYGFWQAPVYPNATTNHKTETTFDCGNGCLFNIQQDPSEYNDLSKSNPEKLQELQSRFSELNKTTFEAPKYGNDVSECLKYVASHKGFVGPYQQPSV